MKSSRKSILIGIASALLVGTAALLVHRSRLIAEHQKEIAALAAAKAKAKLAAEIARHEADNRIPTVKELVHILRPSDIPYEYEMANIAWLHPELKLTVGEIKRLQGEYTSIWRQRSSLEVKLATITNVSNSERLVEIPPYPNDCERIFDEMKSQVSKDFDPSRAQGIISAAYGAYNAPMAYGTQRILVDKIEGSSIFQYKVVIGYSAPSLKYSPSSTTISYLRPGDYLIPGAFLP